MEQIGSIPSALTSIPTGEADAEMEKTYQNGPLDTETHKGGGPGKAFKPQYF